MHFKRLIACTMSFALLLSAVFFTDMFGGSASAGMVDDYQSKISDLEAEQRRIDEEIKRLKGEKKEQEAVQIALQQSIDNLQSQINLCNSEIADFDKQIKQLETDIENKNSQLEETKYLFRQRLRAIYMSGGTGVSSLAVLLDSDNLSDLLAKSEVTRSVSAYDNALMEKIINDVKSIEEDKQEIQKLSDEQKAVKSTLNAKKKELDAQISKVNSELADLNSNIKVDENKKDSLEQAIKEYEDAIKNAQGIGSDQKYDGQFTWPCPGYYMITSPYGYRYHPISGQYKFHKGVDISGGGISGKPIVAAADGIVSLATYNSGGYGYYVMVNHGTNNGKSYVTLYAHMTRYIVSVGQKVTRGQTIGYVGTTGASTGYHLHFEVRVDGNTTNPMSYF